MKKHPKSHSAVRFETKYESNGNTVTGGKMASVVDELAGRRNEDGSSAATGLKKVRIVFSTQV